jgi:hypothetical protein
LGKSSGAQQSGKMFEQKPLQAKKGSKKLCRAKSLWFSAILSNKSLVIQ